MAVEKISKIPKMHVDTLCSWKTITIGLDLWEQKTKLLEQILIFNAMAEIY